jgi:hypothetical protein
MPEGARPMPAIFDKLGVRFMYPENWTLDHDDALQGETSVTLYSPNGTAFWSLVLHPPGTDPTDLINTTLQVMRQTYEQFEAEPVLDTVCDYEMTGYDMNFYCLDLTNTAQVRVFDTDEATGMILCQAEDREFATVEPVFRAITTSLLSKR